VAAGEVAGAVVVVAGGKQPLVACVQALLGEQAVAVVAQLPAQARGQFLLGELAQGVALQAHGRAAVDANADDLVEQVEDSL
jgi:hypothetical protein